MNETTRTRVLVPILMPLTALGAVLLFSGALSRVLLAVDKNISVAVAVGAAAYVMAVAFVVERNPDITRGAVTGVIVLGLVGLTGAGALAQAAGIREIEHHEDEEVIAGAGEAVTIPEDALVWRADAELRYTEAPESATAGELTVALENGSVVHNVAIDGFRGGEPFLDVTDGIDVTTITLEPGTYTYFCSVPGHREGGMEGELEVT